MSTIAENLLALQTAKENIKTAIESKGQDLTGVPFTEYDSKIHAITTGSTGEEADLLKGVLDGSLTEFDNKKVGATSIKPYRFNEFAELVSADFTGITEIPSSVCKNCKKLETLVLDKNTTRVDARAFYSSHYANILKFPKTITYIGSEAFYFFGSLTNNPIEVEMENYCEVGNGAFTKANVSSVKGKFSKLAGFNSDVDQKGKIKTIDIIVNGSIVSSAFSHQQIVENFNIDVNSDITDTGTYCFQSFGINRPNPENNIFVFDFRNSSFPTLESYAFSGTNTTDARNRYFKIMLPKSVTIIGQYCFRYSDNFDIYLTSETPPSLNSSAFNNATNYSISVPYNKVNAYKTATNWVTLANSIKGYSSENEFAVGQKLPLYNSEGYECTWYSDKEMTTQVTHVSDASAIYYCSIGSVQTEVVPININQKNAIIRVADINGNEYSGGGIPVGTQVTITATPTTDGYVPYIFILNNSDISSGNTYTATTGTDINIIAVYYDGVNVPVGETLNDTDFLIIKKVVQDGEASKYWSIGDIKEIEIDGFTYGIRLSDMQIGRYNYANSDRTTNAVFEFVQLYKTAYRMNATNTNAGGWAGSELRTRLNTTILDTFPSELQSLLEDVVIASANGGSTNYTAITTSNNKLFIPSATEVNLSTSYGREEEGTTWDYYVDAVNATRIKQPVNGTSNQYWWSRSPYPTSTNYFTGLRGDGAGYDYYASQALYVCPCFAW